MSCNCHPKPCHPEHKPHCHEPVCKPLKPDCSDCVNGFYCAFPTNYQSTTEEILNYPNFEIAAISNFYDGSSEINELIEFNVYDLKFSDFMYLFYSSPSGGFNIKPCNYYNKLICLNSAQYSSKRGSYINFSLIDEAVKCYQYRNNSVTPTLSPKQRILLVKETQRTNSIAEFCGCSLTLQWDEVLQALETSDSIEQTTEVGQCATVVFTINATIKVKCLDVNISTVFRYKVDIPGYKNVEPVYPDCPYSLSELGCGVKKTKNNETASEYSNEDVSVDYSSKNATFLNDDATNIYTIDTKVLKKLNSSLADGADNSVVGWLNDNN